MEKNLVTSLELSKRLKELGVKQESEFYWSKNIPQKVDNKYHLYFQSVPDGKSSCGQLTEKERNKTCYSAFLSGELGDMLPKGEYLETFFHSLEIQLKITIQGCSKVFQGDTEANARAKMLIYLKENKLI